jgi:ketosteroid isomerase-like protein
VTDLAARLTRVEDESAIRRLVASYGFAVDDRDLAGVTALFAPDGSLRTAGGTAKGTGVDAVGDYFVGRFAALGPTHHFTHDHVIDFDPADPTRATGRVSAHAEVWRDDAPMLTALRYLDEYVKQAEGWRFWSRTQAYLYFVDVRQYPEALGAKLRVRLGPTEDTWKPADWPAGL